MEDLLRGQSSAISNAFSQTDHQVFIILYLVRTGTVGDIFGLEYQVGRGCVLFDINRFDSASVLAGSWGLCY